MSSRPHTRAATPAEAARLAAAMPLDGTTAVSRDPVLHLLRRATWGPTVSVVSDARQTGLDAWIDGQLQPQSIPDDRADAVAGLFPTVGMTTQQIQTTIPRDGWAAMLDLGKATLARQIWSQRQLLEVMVDFWSNHLNVSCPSEAVWDNRTAYDREVIRAHAFGRFSDMLLTSARHPAMLTYLNNWLSTKRAVNENYGRELLELHTVGLAAAYTESDVQNSAKIMTGRTLDHSRDFLYDPERHYIGRIAVLGFSDPNNDADSGLAVSDSYLNYLARHPRTAAHIARKIAIRFVSDDPPSTLVDRLTQAYLDNGTAIIPVLRTLFCSTEFWTAVGAKTRRPLEDLVATARVLDLAPGTDTATATTGFYWLSSVAGHAPLAWRPPDGYPDTAAAWSSTNAVLRAWHAHWVLVRGYPGVQHVAPEQLVGSTTPGTVGAYIDALAERVLFQPLSARERSAVLAFLGKADPRVSVDSKMYGQISYVVPLILDSIAHRRR